MNFLMVFMGGGLGSLARYALSKGFPLQANTFPLATFLSNILACFVMGIAFMILKDKSGIHNWQLFLLTGFCGGFSTFSTFSLETVQLLQSQNYFYAALNILISVISCIFVLYLFLKIK